MVDYNKRGRIAVLTVNNPPVNALRLGVREGILNGMTKAVDDATVDAIVICGKGTFIAGADIKEFSTGEFALDPTLTDITFLIEDCTKPVIAAINGFALGGGLEVALSCHYRIAHNKAQVGFPEVNIGILPAATGTQRLPRVAGLKAALDIIPSGRRVRAAEALKLNIVDKLTDNKDILTEAVVFAESVVNKPLDSRRTTRIPVKHDENAQQLMEDALQKAQKRTPGVMAPVYNIKSVMASIQFPREEALEKEIEYSSVLFSSYQSKALQYAFFAERTAPKWAIPGASYKTAIPVRIRTGAVVGAGTMGTGIAMTMLNSGISVVLVEQNREYLDRGVAILKDLYAGSVRLGKLSQTQADARLGLLKPTTDWAELKNVDTVIEAVFEDMNTKKDVFRKLDQICKPETFLWTNTSFLDIDEIASVTTRPDKVMGVHYFAPAYYMRLVEAIRGEKSSPETISTVMKFATDTGKVPVLVGNCFGFVANRTHVRQVMEANFLVEEGCTPEDVDRSMEDFGYPMGVMKVCDLSGTDISYRMRLGLAERSGVKLDEDIRYLEGDKIGLIHDRLAIMGRLGRKTGKGWYRYEKAHAKVPFNDPEVTDIVLNHSKKWGVEKRNISTQEIFERLTYSVINVGFKCLEEGYASKPEDIDVAWFLGLGWPKHYGGPMFYADMVGVKKIYDRVCYYHQQYPTCEHWQPSELMRKVAKKNIPMTCWAREIQPSKL